MINLVSSITIVILKCIIIFILTTKTIAAISIIAIIIYILHITALFSPLRTTVKIAAIIIFSSSIILSPHDDDFLQVLGLIIPIFPLVKLRGEAREKSQIQVFSFFFRLHDKLQIF